ncbi:MAG: thiosulfate oxidation carrier complex protein SoxZ [Pseudomonadota bacterium]
MFPVRIALPNAAKRGDIMEVRTLIQHPMETGLRRDQRGRAIPRDIITHFQCEYGGEVVFEADFFPAVAANPFLTFPLRAVESGDVIFTWTHQDGGETVETRTLTVE